MRSIANSRCRALWLPSILLVACTGCAHVPQQSESAKLISSEASTAELRAQTVELARETLREIVVAADSIDARTTDPRIHRSTLYWRLSSLAAVQEASLRQDPVLAIIDLLTLELQLQQFLASPAGAATFGSDVPIAERAIARLTERWRVMAKTTGAQLTDEDRAKLDAWVEAHPINGVPYTRASLVGDLARRFREEKGSLGAAVGGIEESISRLEYRVTFINENAVAQAVWLSKLAALEVGQSPEAAELRGTLHSTRGLVEDAPEILRAERLALMAELDRQRLATLVALAQERSIVLQSVMSERAVILEDVDVERQRATRDVDSLRVRTIADSIRVVDHLLLRMAEWVGVLLIIVVLYREWMRRRAPSAADRRAEAQ
jgi:hypothetical protein